MAGDGENSGEPWGVPMSHRACVSELLSAFEEGLCSMKSGLWWKSLRNERQTNLFIKFRNLNQQCKVEINVSRHCDNNSLFL